MNTCLVWGSSCRMSSTSRGKSLTTATAVSFSPSGASPQISLIDGREQQRRVGKELLAIPARECRRRSGDRHDEVRLRTIGERGADVVDDRLFRRADEPCRTDDDLDDVHGFARSLVEVDAEVAGEVIEHQVAAVGLQHQDLLDLGLGPAEDPRSTRQPVSAGPKNLLETLRICLSFVARLEMKGHDDHHFGTWT